MKLEIYTHNWKDHKCIYIVSLKGFCQVRIWDDNSAYLSNLVVFPKYRGKGYGDTLLSIAKQQAESAGVPRLYAYTDGEKWVAEWYRRKGLKVLKH